MLFSSLTFIFIFLPLTLIIYFISKDKYKNNILLLVSLIFYSWGEPKNIFLILLSIIVNYYLAIFIDKSKKYSSLFFVIALIFNIELLFIFKYLDFTLLNINKLFNIDIELANLTLPIGISFYTFQILSYVVDVYRKKIKVQKNILNLSMYISFFPQLIAGPIVRYETIEEELTNRTHSIEKFTSGLERFIIGFAKKIIISNNLALIVDTIYNSSELINSGALIIILASLSYTLQIYYDFSGYSDMAIGLGKIFGFTFLENFNYPYISKSITDFWRRWHISLSSWFRDYVYIPLGGNRVSKLKWIRNILIVWTLTGLWHGASWNYIIWGLYYCFFLLAEKLFLNKILDKLPTLLRWIYMFTIVNVGWIIFRIENISDLTNVLTQLITFKNTNIEEFISKNYTLINNIPYILIAIIFMFPIKQKMDLKYQNNQIYNIINKIILLILFIISIFYLINNSYNPFIYFRF